MIHTKRSDAKLAGAKYYCTGKPCKHDHIVPRFTSSGSCVECVKRVKAAWAKANPEKALRRGRRWYAANKEKGSEITRRWQKLHPETVKEWRIKNIDKQRSYVRNRRARIRQAEGFHTSQDVLDLFEAQSGKCIYCKESLGSSFHVDHILALSRGGRNDVTNLQLCCAICNKRKAAQYHEEFLKRCEFKTV